MNRLQSSRRAASSDHVEMVVERSQLVAASVLDKVATLFLALAFYILPFLNEAGSQIWGVVLLVAASIFALPAGLANRSGPSPFEITLGIAILLSGVVAALRGNSYIVNYSLFMVAMIVSVGAIARHFSLQKILFTAAQAHVANCVTVLLIYWQQLPVILDGASPNRWALRFMPFDMTPNLVGWVYGLGAIVAMYAATKSRGVARVIYALGALASLTYIFGASARGALLATTVSTGVILLANYRRLTPFFRRAVMLTAAVAAFGTLAFGNAIFNYLSIMLELESTSRGLSSGATGRTELWQRGLEYMVNSPQQIFFGSGLRSSNYEFTGFQSESSYITILIDSGLLLGPCIIAAILLSPVALIVTARKSGVGRTEIVFLAWLIIYAASQSFFNRYLLAIGNSGSLLLLLCYSFAWLGFFRNGVRTSGPTNDVRVSAPR